VIFSHAKYAALSFKLLRRVPAMPEKRSRVLFPCSAAAKIWEKNSGHYFKKQEGFRKKLNKEVKNV